jgi:hypothetical protein
VYLNKSKKATYMFDTTVDLAFDVYFREWRKKNVATLTEIQKKARMAVSAARSPSWGEKFTRVSISISTPRRR